MPATHAGLRSSRCQQGGAYSMPTMWFSKDGKRPHTQSGPGTAITFDEAKAVVGSRTLYFAGLEAPSINPDRPSYFETNVVLEVEPGEGISDLLPRPGFYVVIGLKPEAAENKLNAVRGGDGDGC
jgi:hypothetical protein